MDCINCGLYGSESGENRCDLDGGAIGDIYSECHLDKHLTGKKFVELMNKVNVLDIRVRELEKTIASVNLRPMNWTGRWS